MYIFNIIVIIEAALYSCQIIQKPSFLISSQFCTFLDYYFIEKGRKWLHVMVSYVCRSNDHLPHKELGNITFIRIPLPKITRYRYGIATSTIDTQNGINKEWFL